MSGLYIAFSVLLIVISTRTTGAQTTTRQLRLYTSTTELPHNNRIVPRGTTVLLECKVTPHQQQIHYQWTCPQPPCDEEYRKVYNNLILIVATATTGGQYKCRPNPHENEVSATLTVQTSLPESSLTVYNRSKLLLQNTLITDPQQIPNGLVCTTSVSGEVRRFRFEDGTTILGSRQGQSYTVQSQQLNQNGRYVCFDGGREWPFHIYFNNATLPTPQVSTVSSANDPQLRVLLTRLEGYNSGRFILRYDCGFRGIHIELEYRSAELSGSSDVVVRRNRSCFVVGEISRVTVWFVSGRHISCTPAVVNVSSGEVLQSAYTCPTVATPMTSSLSPSTTQSTAATDQSGTHPTSDTPQSTPGPAQNDEQKESIRIEIIAGVTAAAAILFLLLILLIIVAAVLVIKCKRKANNNKGQAYSYVTHDTKGEKKDLMYDDIVPGGHGPPQDDASIGETHPIPLYTDVDKTSKHNNNTATQGQPHPDEYDDIETPGTAHTVNNTSDQGLLPSGYEDLDAANTPSCTEGRAGTEKTLTEGGHVGDLYAVPDKSKKKNKEKNKAASENPPEPPHYEPTADGETGFDPNMLYAVVDKSPKKKK